MNAGGPWAPKLAALAGVEVKLRPGKGIHLVFERRVSNLAIYARGVDGRDMFTFPHEQNSMAGTTDDDFYGDLDRIETTEDEVAYVLQAMERSIPSIRAHRVIHTIQGVRPTLWGFGKNEDELSRDYLVVDHARDGAPGLFTIAGGKLAAYRLMAEDAADRLCAALGVREPGRTATTPLPGGDGTLDVRATARASARRSPRWCASASATARARRACSPTPTPKPARRRRRASSAPASPCSTPSCVTPRAAKGVRRLGDCTLRVRLGVGACQGAGCARQRRGDLLADGARLVGRAPRRGAARLRRASAGAPSRPRSRARISPRWRSTATPSSAARGFAS